MVDVVAPAHLWVPPSSRSSAAVEAIGLAESCGLSLDPEQELVLEAILAEKPNGKWAAFEAALIASRQNLKTFVFEIVVLADLYLFDTSMVVWTAHEFSTTMEAFRDFTTLIESNAHLSRRVKKISNANGEEGIEFSTGQRLRFKARTKAGGRGLTGDRLILDEAFALQPSHMGSLMPTMSAMSINGNPQILYGSSAGQIQSDVLRGLRDRGRNGGDPSLVYIEFCAPEDGCAEAGCDHHVGSVGCVLDDPEMWRLSNPALGRRISEEFVAAERRSLPPEEFARERLGWWEDPIGASVVLPLDSWRLCADESSVPDHAPVVAVDVSPDRSRASIAAAALRSDGRVHVEVVQTGPGVDWVVDRLSSLVTRPRRIVADARSPAGSLITEAELVGVEIEPVTTTQHARSCGLLYDLVVAERVRHLGDPVLDRALAGASKRIVGDGAWLWSRKSSRVDISPLVAVTLAVGAVGVDIDPASQVF